MIINDVFVIMPFTDQTLVLPGGKKREYSQEHFDELYDIVREAVLEYRDTIRVERADDRKSGNILAHVVRRVQDADLVIAVLTSKNANVFWELGIRHALKKGTMMLLAERDEVPFDLHGYFSQLYSISKNSAIKALREFIRERLGEYEREDIEDSPVLDILQRTEYDQFKAWNVIEARRAVLVLEGLFVHLVSAREVYRTALEEALALQKDPKSQLRLVEMDTDNLLVGLRQTRPLIGLNDNAYHDVAKICRISVGFVEGWNSDVERIKGGSADADEAKARISSVAASSLYANDLFMGDVLTALRYVLLEKDAWTIPWGDSLDTIDDLESFSGKELYKLSEEMQAKIEALHEEIRSFETDFGILSPITREEVDNPSPDD